MNKKDMNICLLPLFKRAGFYPKGDIPFSLVKGKGESFMPRYTLIGAILFPISYNKSMHSNLGQPFHQ